MPYLVHPFFCIVYVLHPSNRNVVKAIYSFVEASSNEQFQQ